MTLEDVESHRKYIDEGPRLKSVQNVSSYNEVRQAHIKRSNASGTKRVAHRGLNGGYQLVKADTRVF